MEKKVVNSFLTFITTILQINSIQPVVNAYLL